eukprot:TRINITY_DN41_c0_g1_i1.p1 TRINITY_DN41_c0_g1~~TRINITY_DN41_c0_g1_i1.p1  ORF type:complete len:626 (-),score=152.04 TRINITY_DN41_c0_g1_i1:84-1961(-)
MSDNEDGVEMVTMGGGDIEAGKPSVPRYTRSSTVNWGKVKPVEITWKNLTSTITVGRRKKKTRTLLNNVNGYVRPGQLLAIMGPSGAGKTTMLNLLAGRAYHQKISGEVLVNGKTVPQADLKHFTGFVTQDDVMHTFLTVKETIGFSATMRLPKGMSDKDKAERVQETIMQLGLSKCKHTKIGNTIVRGISGGERKRVNIATEMITNPSVLFLDEPTSGLDASTSLNIISLLKDIAKETGQAIVCTIHQPRSDIFNMFDSLLLLGNGETVYFGPAAKATDYFANAGFPCPQYTNPADHFLDLITPDNSNPEAAELKVKQIEGLINHYKSVETPIGPAMITSEPRKEVARIGWASQLFHLVKRGVTNDMRNLQAIMIRIISAVVMGLIIGSTWFQLGDSQQDLRDRNGFLFFSVLFVSFSEMNAAIATFPEERAIFTHEQSAGVYMVSSYYISKVVADTPLRLLAPLVYAVISYWMVGLKADAGDFFIFLSALWMLSMTLSSFGLAISSLAKTAQIAVAISTVLMIFFMVFGGFFIAADNIPDYYIWIHYISPVTYGFSILLLSQVSSDEVYTCKEVFCQYKTGQDIIDGLSIDVTIYQSFLVLIGLCLIYNLIAYLALRFLNSRK